MIKVLIVDDETKARSLLEALLKEYCPSVEVVGQATDVPEAVKLIQKLKPNLVFLDIEMPNYTGFQLLDFFDEINFDIIFATAYQEYACKAFEVSAIDYLLKPIQIDRLIKSVEKVEKKINKQQNNEIMQALKENLQGDNITKIALPVSDGLLFVEVENIVYFTAEGAYTQVVYRKDQKFNKILISKNIKNFEETLTHSFFFRTHRSYMINLQFVKQFIRQDGGYIVMENGDSVGLSKDRKDEFLNAFQGRF